jgi:predicted acylesterase/phospholipase RssA
VIGVNVIPEPSRITPKLKKSQITRTHQAAKSDEMVHERKLTMRPEVPSRFIQSRVDDIENSIRKFLLHHNKLKSKMLKSLDWLRMETPHIFRLKTPGLINILTQTLTIIEYRVAIENLKDADLVISPDIDDIGFWQFDKAAQAIAVGEKAASLAVQRSKPTSSF